MALFLLNTFTEKSYTECNLRLALYYLMTDVFTLHPEQENDLYVNEDLNIDVVSQ